MENSICHNEVSFICKHTKLRFFFLEKYPAQISTFGT